MFGRRRRGCEHTNRGLARFDEVLSSAGLPVLCDLVAEAAARTRRPRVLEVGCGEGRLLLELLARFGTDVELHGVNDPRWPVVAGARGLHATNARHGVLPRAHLRRWGPPTVHLADAQDLSRFPVEDFDLVVSQVVVPHVTRKDRVLEESARLLAPGGRFLQEIDNWDARGPEVPATDLPRWWITEGGVRVPTTAHLEAHGVRVRSARSGERTVPLADFSRGGGPLRLGLVLDEAATVSLKPMADLDRAHRWGVRSAYRR
jgi:SAM-dependent methyltransferase